MIKKDLLTIGFLCALYYFTGKLGLSLAVVHPSVTVVWPPSGIALAAFMLLGYRVWPGIFFGACLVYLTTMDSLATSLVIATGHTVEALLGALLVRRFANGTRAFDRSNDLVRFVMLGAMTSALTCATIGATSLYFGGFARWENLSAIWTTWWLGDLTSDLVVAPFLLIWGATPFQRRYLGSMLDAAFVVLLILVFGQIVFGDWIFNDIKDYPLSFLSILPLLFATLRFGKHGAVTAGFTMSLIAISGTVNGFGPFAVENPGESLILLQAFMATIAVTTLVLASVLAEREQAEETVRQSEERFRLIVESAPSGIVVINREGQIVLVNSQAERIFGCAKEDLLGRPVERMLPARYRQNQPHLRGHFMTQPQSRPLDPPLELYGVRNDGSEFPVEVGLNPVNTPDGIQVLVTVIDITERKRVEEQLRNSEERVRSMIENVKDHAIFMLDGDGHVLTWNKGAERLRGYREDEIIGQSHEIFFTAEDRAAGRPAQLLQTALKEGQCEDEGWRLRKDGTEFWANAVITAVRDQSGNLLGFSAVTSDLSRRKSIEEELKLAKEQADAANRAKSAFLANISHEIRTPMTGVIGMSGLLYETALTEQQREYCATIRQSGESLLTIINEVLDFSKVEVDKIELEVIDFELRSAVEEVAALFAQQAADKGIELSHFIHCDVPTFLRGDPGRLRQVLSNLVGNAIKFTAAGEVMIHVGLVEQDQAGASLRFTVKDSGIGIAADKFDKLFKAFSQADASVTRKYGGTGLGLVLCKKFVELMGGQIGVDSEEGVGSEFWFNLRLAKAEESSPESLHPSIDLQGLRILIVTASTAIRAVVEHYLGALTIEYHSAGDGPTALEQLRASLPDSARFDMVLLDCKLAGMDSLDLVRAVRQEQGLGSLKIILMTGAGERVDRMSVEPTLIDGHLTKPIGLSHLRECLALVHGKTARPEASDALLPSTIVTARLAQRRLRVLIADDNHINQKVLTSLLEKMGHRADVVGNGKEAVAAFKLVPYDLILMDVQMPELDGFEASRQIRALEAKKSRHTPIIAITAHVTKEDRENCLAAGMDDYVSKPIKHQDLKAAMARRMACAGITAQPPAEPQPPTRAEVLNFSEALDQVGGNRELLREVARIFLEQYPKLLEETHQALSRADFESLGTVAHTLASSAGQLAGRRAFGAAKKLEQVSGARNLSQAPEALAELELELQLLRSAVTDPNFFTLGSGY